MYQGIPNINPALIADWARQRVKSCKDHDIDVYAKLNSFIVTVTAGTIRATPEIALEQEDFSEFLTNVFKNTRAAWPMRVDSLYNLEEYAYKRRRYGSRKEVADGQPHYVSHCLLCGYIWIPDELRHTMATLPIYKFNGLKFQWMGGDLYSYQPEMSVSHFFDI